MAFGCTFYLQLSSAQGNASCYSLFINEDHLGASFLHQKNSNLHMSDPVVHRASAIQKQTGKALVRPAEKILAWLKYLEQSYRRHLDSPEVIQRIKDHYHRLYLTPISDIPESFYDLQIKAARDQGHGTLKMTPKMKKELAKIAIEDQKKSLDDWLDYFLSNDSSSYPMWVKYWSFTGMVKLAKYDPESGTFSNRSKGQMSPFPDLNPEAFALVVDAVIRKVGGRSIDDISDPAFLNLLEGTHFGKLYGRMLQITSGKSAAASTVEGRWVTYKQGEDPKALVESLKGRNSGWCTAGFNTAEKQLAGGDFHVFYSLDENGEAKIPRLAIRMQGPSIAEIRGVGKDQNIDTEMVQSGQVEKKLAEMGESADAFLIKSAHMKKLSSIERKQLAQEELTIDELRFLYEVDSGIFGFGRKKDPRIEEIKKLRSAKRDIAQIFKLRLKDSEISLSAEEAFNEGIKFHFGDLKLPDLDKATGLAFPPTVIGNIFMPSLKSALGLKLPDTLIGQLSIPGLKSAEGLVLPRNFQGRLNLFNLLSAKGLVFPKIFKGDISMPRLETTEGLILPEKLYGSLSLGLKSAYGLILPKIIQGDLYLSDLTSIDHLVLSDRISGDIDLSSLLSVEGLLRPHHFGGRYILKDKESVKKK